MCGRSGAEFEPSLHGDTIMPTTESWSVPTVLSAPQLQTTLVAQPPKIRLQVPKSQMETLLLLILTVAVDALQVMSDPYRVWYAV